MRTYFGVSIFLAGAWLVSGCSKTVKPPVFTMSKSSGQVPLVVDFTHLSEDNSVYQWDFGDGTKSDEHSPSHIYTKAGSHTVVLRAVDGDNVQEGTQVTQTVTVKPGPLGQLVLERSEVTLTPREEYTFSVDGLDEYDNPVSKLTLTFQSADGAGKIDAQGKFTAATKAGTYAHAVTVEATDGEVTERASSDITIIPGTPNRVTIVPNDVTVPAGEQHQFEARVFDAFDNELQRVELTWDAGAAGSIYADGLFTAGSDSGRFTDAIKATVLNGEKRAIGTATVGVPLTIGPYTWPPEKDAKIPAGYQAKHRFCWAAVRATPSHDFPNPYDNIHGPVKVAYLRDLKAGGHKLLHDDWTGHVDTVLAGKTARISIYPEENFRGDPQILEPGETFQLQNSQLDQVASLKIEYVP